MSIYNLRPYIGGIPLVGGYHLSPYINTEGGIFRNFTTLDAAFSMYYTLPSLVLSGDYNVKADVYFTDSGIPIVGSSANDRNNIMVLADGSISWRPTGGLTTFTTAVGVVPSNRLSSIEAIRVGSTGTIEVNGVEVLNESISTGNCTYNAIGRSSSVYADGIISDVQISNVGVLVRDYRINETWIGPSAVLVDYSGNSQHGTAVNIDIDDSENFTFDGIVSPNTWTNDDELIVIEVAGT